MIDQKPAAELPLDVSSRVKGLFALVSEIRDRVRDFPVLSELLRDFQEMTREYILLFEASLRESSMEPGEKWLRRHEMLDKLTREWHVIYSLAAAMELGSSFLDQFNRYVEQAVKDIGMSDYVDDFLLIPIFGPSFSLVTLGYSSSNIAILNLPISVIHSPWELSVIWHEMAGLKVIRIRDQIREFLEAYAKANDLAVPDSRILPGSDLIAELFERITSDVKLDEDFRIKVRTFLSGRDAIAPAQDRIWSQDWFEQLYEDACSVFAFGEEFVSVLEKILRRQPNKLTADRKHPPLETRIRVARRLLELQRRNPSQPATAAERLADDLLWAFMKQKKSDMISALPVADSNPDDIPEVRRELIGHMREFNQNFGDLSRGIHEKPFDFGPMFAHAEKASEKRAPYLSDEDRTVRIKDKLLKLFENAGIEGLLSIPFSPSDELDIRDHNHNVRSSHDNMSINVHNQDHTVFWWGVAHV